jgi:hypothetical protein
MRIIEIKLFKFEELSKEAQQIAINKNLEINLNYEWWDSIYEDAKNIGLKINGFDLDRNKNCTGNLSQAFEDICIDIIKNHGEECETYKTAKKYLSKFNNLVTQYSDGIETEKVKEDKEWDFDNDCKNLEIDFLNDILEDYSNILQKEYEYLYSDESIKETLIANEYYFTEEGKIY